MAAAPKLYRDLVIVLAYTGLRISELCRLKWKDIGEGVIHVVEQLMWDEETETWLRGDPKEELSVRDVVILPETLAALDARFKLERGKGSASNLQAGASITAAAADDGAYGRDLARDLHPRLHGRRGVRGNPREARRDRLRRVMP